jgi:hypothetical protein
MKTKLVLKHTYAENYELKRKARLVVCEYSQVPGVDFQETYAPTTNNIVTSIVCQVCTAKGYYMATFDVTAAFLEGTANCNRAVAHLHLAYQRACGDNRQLVWA